MLFDSPFGQFMTNIFGDYEQSIFSFFGHLHTDVLTWINIALSSLGTELFVFLIALLGVVLCFFRSTRKIGLLFIFSAVFTYVICGWIINPLANRMRPYNACQGNSEYFRWYMNAGAIAEGPYSFPSKHATFDFSLSVSLLLFFVKDFKSKKIKIFGVCIVVIAILVSCSRIYLMLHYPTDVIAGVILGTLFGIGAYYLADLVVRTLPKWCKPFHWMDKVDIEPWLQKRLNKKGKNRSSHKFLIKFATIWICASVIISGCVLVHGINGGFTKCQYRDNNYSCMNKAEDSIYNDNSGQYEDRCKIHKSM